MNVITFIGRVIKTSSKKRVYFNTLVVITLLIPRNVSECRAGAVTVLQINKPKV